MPTDLQIPIILIGSLTVLPAIPPTHSLQRWLPNINWEKFHFELRMWWQMTGLMALATLLRDVPFSTAHFVSALLVFFVAFTIFKHFVSSYSFAISERYAILVGYLAIPLVQSRLISLLALVPIVALLMLWLLKGNWRQWIKLLWGWASTVLVIIWLAVQMPSLAGPLSDVLQTPVAAFYSNHSLLFYLICIVLYFGILRELNRALR